LEREVEVVERLDLREPGGLDPCGATTHLAGRRFLGQDRSGEREVVPPVGLGFRGVGRGGVGDAGHLQRPRVERDLRR
jgi:hypothetical protein